MINVSRSGRPREVKEVLFHLLFTGTLLMAMSSCGKLPGYQVLNKKDAFVADAEINPNVDLLFVIDNSGSMESNQQMVANSFSDFITQFTEKNLKFNIAVITTDMVTTSTMSGTSNTGGSRTGGNSPVACTAHTNLAWWSTNECARHYPNIFNEGPGSFLTKYADELFLTWESADLVTKFQNNAKLTDTGNVSTTFDDIWGGGSEEPLMALQKATTDTGLLAGRHSNFFRSDAFLSVIVVTDEDEATCANGCAGGNPGDYLSSNPTAMNQRISDTIAAFQTLKGTSLEHFSFNVISDPVGSDSCDSDPDAVDAVTLSAMVDKLNTDFPEQVGSGIKRSTLNTICDNFSNDLLQIGSDIVQANARYKLLQPPLNQANITVTINGSVVPRSTTDGWEYFAEGQFIQFYGTKVPSVGDKIAIDYVPGAPI